MIVCELGNPTKENKELRGSGREDRKVDFQWKLRGGGREEVVVGNRRCTTRNIAGKLLTKKLGLRSQHRFCANPDLGSVWMCGWWMMEGLVRNSMEVVRALCIGVVKKCSLGRFGEILEVAGMGEVMHKSLLEWWLTGLWCITLLTVHE